MTGEEFKAAIQRLGKTQVGFAWENDLDDRMVRKWIAKKPPTLVANYAAALLELMDAAKRKARQ